MLPHLLLVLALVLVTVLVASAFKRIPEGQVYSLHRFGRPARMLDAGVHVVLPLVDRVAHKISLTGRVLHLPALPEQGLCREGSVYWQVLEPDRVDAVIEDAEDLIRTSALDLLARSLDCGSESPPARNARIKQSLNEQLRQRGMLITRVNLA